MGRTALNAAVPNPFYGLITDPQATALNGPTVQRFRLLRPMPHFNGANVATSEPPIGDSSPRAADEVGARSRRVQRPGPLHLVEDDRQRLAQLGQRQLARRLDERPEHLGPGRRALALGA